MIDPKEDELPESLAEEVLERLGLTETPSRNLEGLNRLYGAWCRHVPFDNLRKLVALHSPLKTEELPGIRAQDFFSNYLTNGCGGTCWPSSNALFTLLEHCGFDGRRISASMLDSGIRNHGSIIVRLHGDEKSYREWLADSSILTRQVLPLRPSVPYTSSDAAHPVRVEPLEESFRIWWNGLQPDPMPCRLLDDPVDHEFYRKRYEASRSQGVFNERLCVHRYDGEHNEWMLAGKATTTTVDGQETRELEPNQVRQHLIEHFGYSEELVLELQDSMLG